MGERVGGLKSKNAKSFFWFASLSIIGEIIALR